jgi:hypothetical protein
MIRDSEKGTVRVWAFALNGPAAGPISVSTRTRASIKRSRNAVKSRSPSFIDNEHSLQLTVRSRHANSAHNG